MLKVQDTFSIISQENKDAAKVAARLTVGNILNDRAAALITPKLPMMARGYAQTEIGKAVIANVVAGAVVHFLPTNDKAVLASQAMVHSAMANFIGSFNIEDLVNEFFEGINIDALTATATSKASDEASGD